MKFIKYLGIAAICTMSLSSCNDFLDAENKSNGGQNAEDYFSNDPDAILPVAYNALTSFGTNIEMHDRGTDLYMQGKPSDAGVFATFTVDPTNGSVKSYYQNGYAAIKHANALIHYAGEETKTADEGKFIRNYVYYLLTQQFGAVPYVTHFIQDANREYPRTPLDELYGAMITELEDIYNNGRLEAVDRTGHASKQAVAALLAKVYLTAAWDLDTKLTDAQKGTYTVNSTARFAKAAEWAEKAINGVKLTMSFERKWAADNMNNEEEIFSLQYVRAGYPGDELTGGHSLQNNYTCYFGDCTNVGQKGTSGGGDLAAHKAVRLWQKGDERFAATFMLTYYNAPKEGTTAAWGTEGYYAFYNCSAADLNKKYIAYKVFPYYMTDSECEAWLNEHKSQTVKMPANTYGMNTPFAVRLDDGTVTIWNFNTDGSYSKTTQEADNFFAKGGGFSGMSCRKWDDPATAQVVKQNTYRNIPLLHVSEMYLVAAEAYLLAGQEAKALEKVNAVRDRAKAGHLSSFSAYEPDYYTDASFVVTPLDVILDESARETFAEMHRFMDLRRTRQLFRYNLTFSKAIAGGYSQMCNAKGEERWYRPIPADEFNRNTALSLEDQNPGY